MFAISYLFETRTTTALNIGFAFDLDGFNSHPPLAFANFAHQLTANQSHWAHPCMLPCTFLSVHTLRVESYLRDVIGSGVLAVKQLIGVIKAGTSEQQFYSNEPGGSGIEMYRRKLFVDGKVHRSNAPRLTHKINDLSTWIIFEKRSPQWDIQAGDFLLDPT